jgi:hypothetical protein
MSQPIKITESELAEIRMLQGKFQDSILKLGNLQVEKMELDRLVTAFVDREKSLKEEWNSLQKLEQELMETFVTKYGEGNLNMANGTFSPSNPTTKTAGLPPP